ncbi:Ank2 [Symbiodinium microadriaticum]|nr:Ank2 [Symbiodinium sp. KB8]CAE7202846.1 Ank2 [Symbiodinium microadriaticum]
MMMLKRKVTRTLSTRSVEPPQTDEKEEAAGFLLSSAHSRLAKALTGSSHDCKPDQSL